MLTDKKLMALAGKAVGKGGLTAYAMRLARLVEAATLEHFARSAVQRDRYFTAYERKQISAWLKAEASNVRACIEEPPHAP